MANGETTTKNGRMARQASRLPFAGYHRVSRIGARDEELLRSPELAAKAIHAAAERDGETVVMFEAELDVSGSKAKRPILESILERIEAGEFAGLYVVRLNRLTRMAPRARLELFERIEAAGGEVRAASESLDTSTAEGRFAREVFLAAARMEWERAAEGFITAKANAVDKGVAVKAHVPFGYDRPRKSEPLELGAAWERELVVELFERRAAGASLAEVLELFEAGTGRRSSRATVRAMLANRSYVGVVEYGRTAATRLEKIGAHPAIVTEELFAAVQAVNEERGKLGPQNSGLAQSLLAGIARCGGCGRGLVRAAGSRPGDGRRYRCPSNSKHCETRAIIREAELDAFVLDEVIAWAGPVADVTVELELELGARADRVVLEHRLEQAERAAVAYEADVELELEIGAEAYAAGRKARAALVERRRAELATAGEASELEIVRGTLRQVLAADGEYDAAERRSLLRVALTSVVVTKTPRRGAPAAERAVCTFADAASVAGEDATELLEETAARV